MHPQRQKHFHVLDHLVYMLTEPEAADCDKLFLELFVPGPEQSGRVREGLLHFLDADRMGLAQWASEGSGL